MQIVIHCLPEDKDVLLKRFNQPNLSVYWFNAGDNLPIANLYIDYCYEENGPCFTSIKDLPILVQSVIETTSTMPNNYARFNGWKGFTNKNTLEIAGKNEAILQLIDSIFTAINQPFLIAPDEPGMISARVVAMIINEAYFGLGDEISTKEEIDTAMKLGTNYPYGPFEWSQLIGLEKVYALLKKLGENDSRYEVAPRMNLELVGETGSPRDRELGSKMTIDQ